MKSFSLTLVLAATLLAVVLADPEPEPAKGSRYRAAQVINEDSDESGDNDAVGDKQADVAVDADGNKKVGNPSSGRLFMKKFLLFKNMFGNSQQQPIIPIIITGGTGSGTTGSVSPTTTITSTGTVPSATGTITTSPTSPTTPTTPTTAAAAAGTVKRKPLQRIQLAGRGSYDNNAPEEAEEESAVVDNQALAAALAAGAEEYVVTDQEIKGTSDAKANNGPARVNLRRRGSKKGKVVSVRIPPKYRGYFKNGQRVILNNSNRPGKRRVVKKRFVKKRKNKNNKRRRIVAQH